MQESISEKSKFSFFKIKNYWRNIDKQILVSFFLLFILGSFFSFSSTSFLADEKLSKGYYFFFQKHLLYASISFSIMIFISALNTDLLNKSLLPIFLIFFVILMLYHLLELKLKEQKDGYIFLVCVFNQLNLSNHFLF